MEDPAAAAAAAAGNAGQPPAAAGPQPAAPQQQTNNLLDTRGDVKVPNFSGLDTDWDSWKVKFEAYCDLVGLGDYMESAEQCPDPVENSAMLEHAEKASKALHALLVCKCDGKALSIVTLQPRRHGMEAWRQIKLEYEGRQGSRIAAMLREC